MWVFEILNDFVLLFLCKINFLIEVFCNCLLRELLVFCLKYFDLWIKENFKVFVLWNWCLVGDIRKWMIY